MIDGQVITEFGYCGYSIESDYAHIYNLYVLPEYRNNGRAKEIIEKAISDIKFLGYGQKIQIVADPHEAGIDKNRLKLFYKKMGLEVFDYYG